MNYTLTFEFKYADVPIGMSTTVKTIAEVQALLLEHGVGNLTEIDTHEYDLEGNFACGTG